VYVLALALASGCAGQRPLTAVEIDARAEALALHSRWPEARTLVDRGLAEARARGDRAGEARLLLRRGRNVTEETRHRGGDRAPALADIEAAHREAEAAGDPEILADSIDALGLLRFTHWFSSQDPAELAASDELFRQALALREPRGDSRGLADSRFHVGLVHQMKNEPEPAERDFRASLAVAERIHDELRMSYAYRHIGYMAEIRHDLVGAEDGYRRSLELREKVGAGVLVAAGLVALAELRYGRDGDAARAWPMLVRALASAEEAGSAAYVAIAHGAMGRVRRDQGLYDEALEHFATAVAKMEGIGSGEDVPENLEQMALIQLLAGRAAPAKIAVERLFARRQAPRVRALAVLVGLGTPSPDESDPVVAARLLLAAGKPDAALDAAVKGDDPDTLLLAAQATGGADAFRRAVVAAAGLSRAQELRFQRISTSRP